MTRSIFVAAAAEKRLCRVETWLRDLSPAAESLPATREVLILAPTRGAADDLLRRVGDTPGAGRPGAGIFGVHRFTVKQLAADLATRALASAGLAPVSGLSIEALAARTISIRAAAEELDYFAPVADAPGFARALASTLREIRAGGIGAAELRGSGRRGRDLARLLETYEQELERWSLVDEAAMFELARREVEQGDHRLSGLPFVLLDLSPTTAAEQRLLSKLAERAPAVLATTLTGDAAGRRALEAVLGVEAEDLEAREPDSSSRLERLRRRIFEPGAPQPGAPQPGAPQPGASRADTGAEATTDTDTADADTADVDTADVDTADVNTADTDTADDSSVAFLSAPGEGRECVEIARRILELAVDGTAFDHVAVLLRDPETYLPLVEEALGRAGVLAYFTRGTTRPHPAGRALLALLACAAERLAASRFAEYLSLAQVPFPDPAGAPPQEEVPWVAPEGDQLVFKTLMPVAPPEVPADAGETHRDPVIAGTLRSPRHWERLLVDAAVLGGEDRWRRRLDGLEAEIRLQLTGLDSDDHPRRERLHRRLEQLGYLKRFALPVIARLAELPEAATWGEWLDALEDLCGRVLREPERVLALLAELRPMDRVGPVPLDEVRRVLEERLTSLSSEPPERRYGRVFVATVAEARGRSFAAVFLPGLAEGLFPRRASEDPLLLDDDRRRIAETLVTQRERVEQERLLLRVAAGAARSLLTVSYPNLDSLQGRSRVPSFYALDLLRAAEGRLPDLGQLEARAAAASQSLLGWPAPRSPQASIDDAEYDLSTLEPLLGRPDEEVRSRGRYLLLTNDRLERSLRARYRRWHPRFTPADGVVAPDEATLAALRPHRLRHRSYSPTALQNFAACPYRFLLAAVHKLRPRERAAWLEQLDPLTRGALFHKVQFELFGKLDERRMLPMQEDDLAALLALADRVLDRVAGGYEEELAPAIPRVWRSEIEALRTDLRGWIRSVVAAAEPWRPAHFELAFGLDEPLVADDEMPPVATAPPATTAAEIPSEQVEVANDTPQPVQFTLRFDGELGEAPQPAAAETAPREAVILDGKRVRGAIDLVELHPDRDSLRITDHKTGAGRRSKRLVVGGGEVLQPLLYALAAEYHLGRQGESGRLFYCTRKGRYESVEVPLSDENRQAASLVLDVIDRALEEGFLPAAPREGACRFCDYHPVCGPWEERRILKKHPQRLVLLSQLRGLP